jgi:hypothetical protein
VFVAAIVGGVGVAVDFGGVGQAVELFQRVQSFGEAGAQPQNWA